MGLQDNLVWWALYLWGGCICHPNSSPQFPGFRESLDYAYNAGTKKAPKKAPLVKDTFSGTLPTYHLLDNRKTGTTPNGHHRSFFPFCNCFVVFSTFFGVRPFERKNEKNPSRRAALDLRFFLRTLPNPPSSGPGRGAVLCGISLGGNPRQKHWAVYGHFPNIFAISRQNHTQASRPWFGPGPHPRGFCVKRNGAWNLVIQLRLTPCQS